MVTRNIIVATVVYFFASGSAIFAQTAPSNICPFGSELLIKASDSYDGSKGTALATLLWLERGDDLWMRRTSDPEHLRSRYSSITFSYGYGANGYPKSKKTKKRLEQYLEANGEAGRILPRPKGVPSEPPLSAIQDAQTELKCRYDPDAAQKETPAIRALRHADRDICSVTYTQAEARKRPMEMMVKRDEKDRYQKALAILEWNLRGSALFDTPDEEGKLLPAWRKNYLRKLFKTGESFAVPPRADMLAAIDQHLSGGQISKVLDAPSTHMVYWAEDLLKCRYDATEWHSNVQNRAQERHDEIVARIALREEERKLNEESEIRKVEYDRKLQKFARDNQNCQSEYEKIFFVMSGKPLPNAQVCKQDCSPGFSEVTPDQIDYAFFCDKAQSRGLVSRPPNNAILDRRPDPNAPAIYTLQDGFRDMSRAIACTRKEQKCYKDSQYERCKMVIVDIC